MRDLNKSIEFGDLQNKLVEKQKEFINLLKENPSDQRLRVLNDELNELVAKVKITKKSSNETFL